MENIQEEDLGFLGLEEVDEEIFDNLYDKYVLTHKQNMNGNGSRLSHSLPEEKIELSDKTEQQLTIEQLEKILLDYLILMNRKKLREKG
jgi:hypothetical protein